MFKKILLFSSLFIPIFLYSTSIHSQQPNQKSKQLRQEIKEETKITPTIELTGRINQRTIGNLTHTLKLLRKQPYKIEKLLLIINSSGGKVNSSKTAYQHLKNLPFTLHTHNIANASSGAAAIYCAGDIRTASKDAHFVLHYPTMSGQEVYSENQSLARHEVMKNYSKFMERATSNCTNLSQKQIENILQKETVYNVNEALNIGLIQKIKYPKNEINDSCLQYTIVGGSLVNTNYCQRKINVKKKLKKLQKLQKQ